MITEEDRTAVIDLLSEGFEDRRRSHWEAGLDRMSRRAVPEDCPRYGYVLDTGTRLVGVLLLIWSSRKTQGSEVLVGNVASWYCNPEFRGYAQLLVSVALRDKKRSYLNISPAPHTWSILENQGYRPYCRGLFFAYGALARGQVGARIASVSPGRNPPDIETMPEYEMLREHAGYGCTVLVCRHNDELYPFIFRRFYIRSGRIPTPGAMTIYCRNQPELIRYMGNIGRYLALRAMPVVIMNANEPFEVLPGFYTEKSGRKFCRGSFQPSLCDLSNTEFALFDL